MAPKRKTRKTRKYNRYTDEDLSRAQVDCQNAESEVAAAGIAVAASLINLDDARDHYKHSLEDMAAKEEQYRVIYDWTGNE